MNRSFSSLNGGGPQQPQHNSSSMMIAVSTQHPYQPRTTSMLTHSSRIQGRPHQQQQRTIDLAFDKLPKLAPTRHHHRRKSSLSSCSNKTTRKLRFDRNVSMHTYEAPAKKLHDRLYWNDADIDARLERERQGADEHADQIANCILCLHGYLVDDSSSTPVDRETAVRTILKADCRSLEHMYASQLVEHRKGAVRKILSVQDEARALAPHLMDNLLRAWSLRLSSGPCRYSIMAAKMDEMFVLEEEFQVDAEDLVLMSLETLDLGE